MDRSLREHIEGLKARRQLLTAQLMDEESGSLKARGDLEAELRALDSALTFCRSAFTGLRLRLRGAFPNRKDPFLKLSAN